MPQVFIHRLRKYIGAYLVHLKGNVDAVVFSAGLGENSAYTRKEALSNLEASFFTTVVSACEFASFHISILS